MIFKISILFLFVIICILYLKYRKMGTYNEGMQDDLENGENITLGEKIFHIYFKLNNLEDGSIFNYGDTQGNKAFLLKLENNILKLNSQVIYDTGLVIDKNYYISIHFNDNVNYIVTLYDDTLLVEKKDITLESFDNETDNFVVGFESIPGLVEFKGIEKANYKMSDEFQKEDGNINYILMIENFKDSTNASNNSTYTVPDEQVDDVDAYSNSTMKPFGKYKLVLRQTILNKTSNFNSLNMTSLNNALNLDSEYTEDGTIKEGDYYNPSLLNKNIWRGKQYFMQKKYNNNTLNETIEWVQDPITNDTPGNFVKINSMPVNWVQQPLKLYNNENYLIKSVQDNNLYKLGVKDIELYNDLLPQPNQNQNNKVELYIWQSSPSDINSYNDNFDGFEIQKVKMSDEQYWNKTKDKKETAESNAFSYCFGKLRCSKEGTLQKDVDGNYLPYCDEDNLEPVYCESSFLYNTNETISLEPVKLKDCHSDKDISFSIIGKFAKEKDTEENITLFNKFRGLTIPKVLKHPELSGNYVKLYEDNDNYINIHKCDLLNNSTELGITEKCSAGYNDYGKCHQKLNYDVGKKCVGNYGDTIDSKYKDYICEKDETCESYICGARFGNCTPKTL